MTDLKWHNEGLDAQRERIATAAMAAIVSHEGNSMRSAERMAETAVYYADALIKDLNSGS